LKTLYVIFKKRFAREFMMIKGAEVIERGRKIKT